MAATDLKPMLRRRIGLDALYMEPFKMLCDALARLVEAEIITPAQARALLAEYNMEPRDDRTT